MYQTIEATLENKKVIFSEKYNIPVKSTKILITFLDKENKWNIEPLHWSSEVLWTKDHKDFISLLKSA